MNFKIEIQNTFFSLNKVKTVSFDILSCLSPCIICNVQYFVPNSHQLSLIPPHTTSYFAAENLGWNQGQSIRIQDTMLDITNNIFVSILESIQNKNMNLCFRLSNCIFCHEYID